MCLKESFETCFNSMIHVYHVSKLNVHIGGIYMVGTILEKIYFCIYKVVDFKFLCHYQTNKAPHCNRKVLARSHALCSKFDIIVFLDMISCWGVNPKQMCGFTLFVGVGLIRLNKGWWEIFYGVFCHLKTFNLFLKSMCCFYVF